MSIYQPFNASDAVQSYRWLGHEGNGYTELLAIHPDYRPGQENYNYNIQKQAFPRVWYVQNEREVLSFLSKYHGDYLCCYGVNPRPDILKTDKGYARRARDDDIKAVQNFYLDFDFEGGLTRGKEKQVLEDFLETVEEDISKSGFNKPARAFTGNGYHSLYALPPVQVEEHEDISDRLDAFYQVVNNKYASDLAGNGIRLDKTTDLSRVAKIYGTRKPGKPALSHFYGTQRTEDYALLEYLLSLPIDTPGRSRRERKAGLTVSTYDSLPPSFQELLEKDATAAKLWRGEGKVNGDTTRSGYDMTLAHYAIRHAGITDAKALATILAMRENGAVRESGKGDDYIRLTVLRALENSKW